MLRNCGGGLLSAMEWRGSSACFRHRCQTTAGANPKSCENTLAGTGSAHLDRELHRRSIDVVPDGGAAGRARLGCCVCCCGGTTPPGQGVEKQGRAQGSYYPIVQI